MIFNIFLALFVFQHSATASEENCSTSIPTLKVVSACPKNEIELSNAKEQKRCDVKANYQTCVEPINYTYHCVLNTWTNDTVEVCAPEIPSQGFCVKFDIGGARLQEIYRMDCTKFSKPCRTRFRSSDVLHYVQCTEIANTTNTIKTIVIENELNNHLLVGLVVVTVVLVVFCIIVGCIYKYRDHSSQNQKKQTDKVKEKIALIECSNEDDNTNNHNMESAQVNVDDGQNVGNTLSGPKDLENKEKIKCNPDVSIDNIQPLDQSNRDDRKVNQKMESAQVIVGNHQAMNEILQGSKDATFNIKNFEEVMEKYHINFIDKLRDNGIDCLATFCSMDEKQFEEMGLKVGQIKKCILVAKELMKNE